MPSIRLVWQTEVSWEISVLKLLGNNQVIALENRSNKYTRHLTKIEFMRGEIAELEEQVEDLIREQCSQARDYDVGILHPFLSGLTKLEGTFDKSNTP